MLIADGMAFTLFYDNEDAFRYCQDYLESLDLKSASITIFLGFGLGYHLHVFTRLFATRLDARKIIVFEDNMNIFCLALHLVDIRDLIAHPDIHFFINEEAQYTYTALRRDVLPDKGTNNFMRSAKVIPVPSSIALNRDYYKQSLDITKRACLQVVILAGNDPIDSLLGLDNVLMNIPQIVSNPGIDLLYDLFKGKPAISVAAGPSLNQNIHLLREVTDKALIICCDASFLPLMKRNIRPHIVVGFERTDGTEYFYEGISDFEDIYLAVCPLVRPKTFDYFKGKKIIVHRTFSHFDWLHYNKGALSIGPSVGNMAFTVAEALGCDPIILIGQDLAFAEDGNTHVKDMPFGERDEFYHEKVLEVEGNHGKPVKTSHAWHVFRMYFEEDIHNYSGRCINATEGGAKIRGAKVMPFREAIDTYCNNEFNPVSMIDDAISDFDKNLDIHNELNVFLDRITVTRQGLDELIQKFKELLDETRMVQKNMLYPFIYENKMFDKEIATSISQKFLDLLQVYVKKDNIRDIMLHTIQPHIMWFTNKFNSLPDLYSDEECLRVAQTLMIKDWLGVMGQLYVSTIDILGKTEKMLIAELEKDSNIARYPQ
ncbi:MAG: DUF115 domain-containing protein, partial [Candidatus Bathyarchaeota archaeon]|nr:DUF115 domain-containing protein [Candidatus Bathyarchaeota archaeon]